MIRAVSILLILWGCAFAQSPIKITSSTPMGMPCGGLTGIQATGCMPDDLCGWMVVMPTGDAAAFIGTLTYFDAEGNEKTATVTTAANSEYTVLAFRVGVFRVGGNRFGSVEISSLKASATVRQDAEGAIITVGETTWGPPRVGWFSSPVLGKRSSDGTVVRLADDSADYKWRGAGSRPLLESGDTLLRFSETGSTIVALKFVGGKVVVEQPEVIPHPAIVGESLSCNLCTTTVRLAGESLRVTPRVVGLTTIITKGDNAQATTNLKEYHQ